ncbi:MAG: VacJ family lipoprotein [Rubrivivax sp.]
MAGGSGSATATPGDPFESWNRSVYTFNDRLDTKLMRPAAEAYRKVVPELVRTGIGNVFGNIGDAWSAANHLLQGKLQTGLEMGMRVLVNTGFGLGGLLDPASEMGLTKRPEDFGQTLGRWGVGPGPFVMLPVLGPSTLRDTVAWPVDRLIAPSTLPHTGAGRYTVAAMEVINTRTLLLQTTGLIDQVALDRYSFIRDAYLARRLDQVYDGAPPLPSFDDEAPEPAETPKK